MSYFLNLNKSDEKITREAFFNSKAIIILNNKDIDEMLKRLQLKS